MPPIELLKKSLAFITWDTEIKNWQMKYAMKHRIGLEPMGFQQDKNQ
jgi:hypothetical protein